MSDKLTAELVAVAALACSLYVLFPPTAVGVLAGYGAVWVFRLILAVVRWVKGGA